MVAVLGVKQRTNIWLLIAYPRDGQKGKPPQNEFTLLQSPVLKNVHRGHFSFGNQAYLHGVERGSCFGNLI